MAKISKVIRKAECGYDKIFGKHPFSIAMQEAQSATIRSGMELEKVIESSCPEETLIRDLKGFVDNIDGHPDGTYLCPKTAANFKSFFLKKVPDFLVFTIANGVVKGTIVEMKSGCFFDTKKVSGEQTYMKSCKRQLKKLLPANTRVTYKICSFEQSDINVIANGCKNLIGKKHLMTGRSFCNLLNIDYDTIVNQMHSDHKKNVAYFAYKMSEIPEVREAVLASCM